MSKTQKLFERRKQRVRNKIRKTSTGRLRLSVYRSSNHIYAQLIDDTKGVTLLSSSTMDKQIADKIKGKGGNKEAARLVGLEIAEKAKKAKVLEVVFDRGGYLYHGRIKALAEAAREAGLKF